MTETPWTSMRTEDEHQIHYLDNFGQGPVIVFSHGFFMDARMFEAQASELGKRFRLIAIDARGHGKTLAAGKPFDYWDLAADELAVLDAAGVERAHLVGHSQGGFTALRVALEAPERVMSLTLLASQARANTPEVVAGYEELFALWRSGEVSQPVIERLALQLVGDLVMAKSWSDRWAGIPWSEIGPASEALMRRDNITERLLEITAPVQLILGTDDGGLSEESQRELIKELTGTNAELVMIEGGAHAVNLKHAALVTPLIASFVRSAEAR